MKNPGLAAVLSFFVIGLGQIYNGHIGYGLLMLVTYYLIAIFAWASIIAGFSDPTGSWIGVVLGLVMLIIWISGIVSAYKDADNYNKQLKS